MQNEKLDKINTINDIEKKLSNESKNINKVSGIYILLNKINNKWYVGSSVNIVRERYRHHKNMLRKNIHHCLHLQRAWNKYGENCFEFHIVELVNENITDVEQLYLNYGKMNCRYMMYNTAEDAIAPTRGLKLTEEHKRKISFSGRGKQVGKLNPMWKIGNKHPLYGKKQTDESKRKNSESNKIAQRGERNSRYDHSHYTFHNKLTGEIFVGTRYEFYTKHNTKNNIHTLINGKTKSVKGWIVIKT